MLVPQRDDGAGIGVQSLSGTSPIVPRWISCFLIVAAAANRPPATTGRKFNPPRPVPQRFETAWEKKKLAAQDAAPSSVVIE